MDIERSIIIIACERYTGEYPNLPGAISSAHTIREWATEESYNVLYLGDDQYPEITTKLVSDKVNNLINSKYLDRLVVYFAGHGLVRSTASQFWLLTNAYDDIMEGIYVEGFRRGLAKCNIGASSPILTTGQLCMIADACRNTDRESLDFHGHPIITQAHGTKFDIEYDRYFSTGLGEYSYQIAATNDQPAYCLFSEILVNALNGLVPEAIEQKHHRFKPAVTNHKLGSYLKKEVPQRAAAHGDMSPDIITDISPDFNIYKSLTGPIPSAPPDVANEVLEAVGMGVGFTTQRDTENRKEVLSQSLESIKGVIDKEPIDRIRGNWIGHQAILCHGFQPEEVSIPVGTKANLDKGDNETFYIVTSNKEGLPVLVRNESFWTLVPIYPGTIPVISNTFPGDTLLYKFKTEDWDTALSDFAMLRGDVPRHAIEARIMADQVRTGKYLYPHLSVVAAYLYEFANDYDNIARTAHFMAEFTRSPNCPKNVVPFDLALLCADRIYWERDEHGVQRAYADLPKVPEGREETDFVSNTFMSRRRPIFTTTSLKSKERVPLWGIAPIFREGWYFLEQNADSLEIPDNIRTLSSKTSGRSTTTFSNTALKLFSNAFHYNAIDLKVFPGIKRK